MIINTGHTLEMARSALKSIEDRDCNEETLRIYEAACHLVDVCEKQRELINTMRVNHQSLYDRVHTAPCPDKPSPEKEITDERAGDALIAIVKWFTQ